MVITYHKNATTTVRIRRNIQKSEEPIIKLASRYKVHRNTVSKWKHRDDLRDRSTRPHQLSTILSALDEWLICEVRRVTKLGIDEITEIVNDAIPHANRDNVYKCLRRNELLKIYDLRKSGSWQNENAHNDKQPKNRNNENETYKKALKTIHLCYIILTVIGWKLNFKTNCIVKAVKDGDTVVVSPIDGGQFIACRLYGIDTPEMKKFDLPGQPYAKEAARKLSRLILGCTVTLNFKGQVSHNRYVCLILKDGIDINIEMVKDGYAWAYRKYLRGTDFYDPYIQAEKIAKKKKLGLWQDPKPIAPWRFKNIVRSNLNSNVIT